jgi:hypothetical protein
LPAAPVLHDVIDGHAGGDRAARRVDVQGDVPLVVLGREQDQLGTDPVGQLIVDLLAEEDDPVAQQPAEQLVPEGDGWGLRDPRHEARQLLILGGRRHGALLLLCATVVAPTARKCR